MIFLFGCNFFRFGRISVPEREGQIRRRFCRPAQLRHAWLYWPVTNPNAASRSTNTPTGWSIGAAKTASPAKGILWCGTSPTRAGCPRISRKSARCPTPASATSWRASRDASTSGTWSTNRRTWGDSKRAPENGRSRWGGALRGGTPENSPRRQPGRDAAGQRLSHRPALFQNPGGIARKRETPFLTPSAFKATCTAAAGPLRRIWEVCDTYSEFKVPIHFTETTISERAARRTREVGATTPEGEAMQAEYVPQFYTLLFAHPAVHGLTWWDFSGRCRVAGVSAGRLDTQRHVAQAGLRASRWR